jgi:hypothetical protein
MKRTGRSIRKAFSAGLALLMLTLSVAVPVLERADITTGPVAESEHNPATCPPPHDHTVCTTVTSNLAAPAPSHEGDFAQVVLHEATPDDAASAVPAPFPEGHPSRAPPRA